MSRISRARRCAKQTWRSNWRRRVWPGSRRPSTVRVQAGRQSLRGDADVTALNTAVTSLVNEYARIMSSPGASGGTTSDHARAEAAGLLNNAMNADQFGAAIATMKRSMANRVSAINAQIGTTVRDIQSGGGVSAPLGNPPENPASAPIPPATAAPNAANAPPASMLKEGYAQAFKNGQVWTLRNGAPGEAEVMDWETARRPDAAQQHPLT